MKTLARGQKLKLADLAPSLQLRVGIDAIGPGLSFDISCFGLDANGKLADDRYFIFYNQSAAPDGSITMRGKQGGDSETFEIDLARLSPVIHRLVFVVTVDGAGTMSQLSLGHWRLLSGGGEVARFSFAGRDFGGEAAVMIAELYRKDVWRVAAIGQGFAGGLGAVLRHFGGEEDGAALPPPPLPPPSPGPAPPANQSNRCSDCGAMMTLLERAGNLVAGDRRCSACDRRHNEEQRRLAQAQNNTRGAARQQFIQNILDGNLSIVAPAEAGIVFRKNEVCHYVTQAALYEERVTSTVRTRASAGVRIGRGLRIGAGATIGKTIPIMGMVHIDTGRLLITNQRYVFNGQTKSFSILFAKVISFEAFADGLAIYPENKKTQQYKIGDGELAAAILSVAVNA